jgi:hypothetical protein
MRGWYRPRDLLGGIRECIIPETSTLQETASLILAQTTLLHHPAGDSGTARESHVNAEQRYP